RGMNYPTARLDRAWKSMLFNQFHDILPGSAIDTAYEDARNEIGGVIAEAHRITNLALQTTARDIHIPPDENSQPVLVFNPHPFPVQLTAELELSFLPLDWSMA